LTDEQSQQILRQIRNAASGAARLLVVETVLPNEGAWAADKGEHFGNHLDINMLVLTGGASGHQMNLLGCSPTPDGVPAGDPYAQSVFHRRSGRRLTGVRARDAHGR